MRANACPELAEEGVVCYVGEGQAGEQGFDDNDDGGDDDEVKRHRPVWIG